MTTYTRTDTDLVMTTGMAGNMALGGARGASDISSLNGEGASRQYILKLRDLPTDDKPREKLIEHGVEALSLQELISVVLNTGSKKEDVMAMSQKIVREYGNSALTGTVNPTTMATELDIPLGKACQVVACSEIGKRLYKKSDVGLAVIRTADDVYKHLSDMQTLPKEQLRGLYLDTHNRVIHQEIISIGTINSNIVHPREVFRPALEYNAVAIVLAHNHPSGVVTPSLSDSQITKQIIEAGKIIGIHLLDHVIITKDGFASVPAEY